MTFHGSPLGITDSARKSLTLYVLSFQRKQRHKFIFYVMPPHWHDTCSWNSSSCNTRTYLVYIVNIMGSDVLATQGVRASATTIFTMLTELIQSPHFKASGAASISDISYCMMSQRLAPAPLGVECSYCFTNWQTTRTNCLLPHWGRVAHIGEGNLTIVRPDNGLSPDRHQAIIWTNARI